MFASTLTTGALWRDSVALDAGQVSSGSLVLLNGDAVTQVEAYAFTAWPAATCARAAAPRRP
jgi:hypothetical protein